MENTNVLIKLVRKAIKVEKHERYLSSLTKNKGKKKLSAALDHDLERDIDDNRIVKELSKSEWLKGGIFFSTQGDYGIITKTIKNAYDDAPWQGGWFILSESRLCYLLAGRKNG